MHIKLNGKIEEIPKGISSLRDLVVFKELKLERVVIEHNFEIVPRIKWGEASIMDNDSIEIVSFVGGG